MDALICDNVRDFIALFRDLPNAKASFATKFVNREMLGFDPQRKTVFASAFMPQSIARVVDVARLLFPNALPPLTISMMPVTKCISTFRLSFITRAGSTITAPCAPAIQSSLNSASAFSKCSYVSILPVPLSNKVPLYTAEGDIGSTRFS